MPLQRLEGHHRCIVPVEYHHPQHLATWLEVEVPALCIHGGQCPNPSTAVLEQSAAPFLAQKRSRALLSCSSVFPGPTLIHSRRFGNSCGAVTRLSARADVGTASVDEEELVAKPKQSWHSLPSGLRLEVLSVEARGEETKPPVVFVHGSYHAAWCWAVHWLPYFASLGFDSYAISLLGQGASDPPSDPGPAGTIQTHARDVAHFVASVSQRCKRPPVLIGHSFGGLIVQYYLSQVSTNVGVPSVGGGTEPYPNLAGAVLVCSVPPTGNGRVVKRFLMSKPIASIKVTLSLAAKMFATSVPLCRETFFSLSMPEEDVARYQKLMKESSKVPLFDLRQLNSSLPVPPPVKNAPPVLVVGAENDFILDKQGIEETASFLGTEEVIVAGVAHDVMIDLGWRDAADVLKSWMLTKF